MTLTTTSVTGTELSDGITQEYTQGAVSLSVSADTIPDYLPDADTSIQTEPYSDMPAEIGDENIINPETDASTDAFTISGKTLTVSALDGTDITKPLQAALSEAGSLASENNIYTVTVPAGNYLLTNGLRIYSNTSLSLYGVTLTQGTSTKTGMLSLGDASYVNSPDCAGYTGFKNISVLGGTFQAAKGHDCSPIRLMHASNITLKDLTVCGGEADHLVEVVALNNFLVDGCTFRDMSPSVRRATREALQLDIAVYPEIYSNIYHDGTMMKNVTIQNCTFSNVSRGVGTHAALVNAYHENIKILNNTFTDVEQQCVLCVNYHNVEISGNTMLRCGGGILTEYSKENTNTLHTTILNGTTPYTGILRHDAKTVIRNNTIQTRYTPFCLSVAGIEAAGRNITSPEKNTNTNSTIPAADYYISGVEIADNTITTGGYGIVLQDAKNCTITGNKITTGTYSSEDSIAKSRRYSGIHSGQASTDNIFRNNTISGVQSNGFFFQNGSSAAEITGNTISSCGGDGINLNETCSVKGSIASNTITGSSEHGIVIHDGAKVGGDITANNISSAKLNGIYLYGKAACAGSITDNTVTDSVLNGINLADSAVLGGSIRNNTISSSQKTGIQIINKSSVHGNVEDNTVTGSKLNGICLMTSAEVKQDIASNVIKNAKKYGIYVYGKSKVGGSITENTISSTDTAVVAAPTCSVSIRKNSFQKNKNNISKIVTTSIKVTTLKNTAFTSASGKGRKIRLKWKKVKNADGYCIELSSQSDFSKIIKTIKTTSTKGVFKNLKKGQTYYVRISTYKKSGKAYIYSNYSKAKKIKVS